MIYYMSYLVYMWRIYRIIMITHGIYVAINFVSWMIGETINTFIWVISWFPQPLLQIEDKKYEDKKYEDKKYIEEEVDNKFTLLTQS